MKEIAFFIIIVALISVSYVVLAHVEKNGFNVQKVFADLSSSLEFEYPEIEVKKETKKPAEKTIKSPEKRPQEQIEPEKKEEPKVQLRISDVSAENYYRPSLITLNYKTGKEKVNITGWKIKTRQGEFTISQGIEKYNSYATESDIFAGQYETVYIIGDKSPLGRKNFRTNKCFCYLTESYKFYPSIWSSCPSASKKEDTSYLSSACQDFIERFYGCETPNYSQKLEIATDSACVGYINRHFNYNGCLDDYSKDNDFLQNRWYIYTGSDIVDSSHDTIYLYDQKGNLIDKYSY